MQFLTVNWHLISKASLITEFPGSGPISKWILARQESIISKLWATYAIYSNQSQQFAQWVRNTTKQWARQWHGFAVSRQSSPMMDDVATTYPRTRNNKIKRTGKKIIIIIKINNSNNLTYELGPSSKCSSIFKGKMEQENKTW